MDVGFHHGRVGADDVGGDDFLRNSILAKQFVDLPPGFRADGEEALVEKAEVHHGLLSPSAGSPGGTGRRRCG